MIVPFAFTQTLETAYKNLAVEVEFYGEAQATGDKIAILKAFSRIENSITSLEILGGFGPEETLEMQYNATGWYGQFLANCRNAAHQTLLAEGYFDPQRADLRKPIMPLELSEI